MDAEAAVATAKVARGNATGFIVGRVMGALATFHYRGMGALHWKHNLEKCVVQTYRFLCILAAIKSLVLADVHSEV